MAPLTPRDQGRHGGFSLKHGDNTYVEVVTEPVYRAECGHCGWTGPNRSQYEDAVTDGQEHAIERDDLGR